MLKVTLRERTDCGAGESDAMGHGAMVSLVQWGYQRISTTLEINTVFDPTLYKLN